MWYETVSNQTVPGADLEQQQPEENMIIRWIGDQRGLIKTVATWKEMWVVWKTNHIFGKGKSVDTV